MGSCLSPGSASLPQSQRGGQCLPSAPSSCTLWPEPRPGARDGLHPVRPNFPGPGKGEALGLSMMGWGGAGSPGASLTAPSTLLLGGGASPHPEICFEGDMCRLSLPQMRGIFSWARLGLCRTTSISGLPCLAAVRQHLPLPWVVLSTSAKPPKPKGSSLGFPEMFTYCLFL